MVKSTRGLLFACAVSALACDVPEPPAATGGVMVPPGPCGRGYVVMSSDYVSTNISLTAVDGHPLSESLFSSSSAPPGLSAALSGDVILPSATPESGRVVLIDENANGVLTFIAPETGGVTAQLTLGAGFTPHGHDYLEIDETTAYVTRYETNTGSAATPLDAGGDILVVDTRTPARLGRIDLTPSAMSSFLPRADRMLRLGDEVLVVLQQFDAAFKSAADTRLVGVSIATSKVVWIRDVPGLKSCGGPVVSPSGTRIALPCTGLFVDSTGQLAESAVVLFDAEARPPVEVRRYSVADVLGAPLGPSVAFASERLLLGTAYGELDNGGRPDVAFSLDLETGAAAVLLTSGTAFVLGDVRCPTGCDAPCILADAEIGALRRFRFMSDGTPLELEPLRVDSRIGLPPRTLGGF